ncbi:MAG: hypothetical protein ACOX7P_02380 [Oscillospiraceae bacterium]
MPETISMYEKIARVNLLELNEADLSGVYIIVSILCALMAAAYIADRIKQKKLSEKNRRDN